MKTTVGDEIGETHLGYVLVFDFMILGLCIAVEGNVVEGWLAQTKCSESIQIGKKDAACQDRSLHRSRFK